jgi:uncharacterized protein (TIGR03437 family)
MASIAVGGNPDGLAATPDGTKVYLGPSVYIFTRSDTFFQAQYPPVSGSAFVGTFIGPEPPPLAFPTINSAGPVDPWTYTKGLSPGAWVSIFGTNFMTGNPLSWAPQPDQPLATKLGGITVSIDGVLAPISYVSPTQVNVLVPAGVHLGQVQIFVTNDVVNGPPLVVTSTPFLPAIYSNAGPGISPSRYYVTAVDPITGSLLGTASADPRVARAVRAGDTIDLYAIGLGSTTPQFPTNTDFIGAFSLASTLNVVLGGISLKPSFAALVAPGLYQIRIAVPSTLQPGDQAILLDFGSAQSAGNVYLTVQR